LELGVLDACKNVAYVDELQKSIKSLLKFYSRSSKRLRELSCAGEILHSTIRKFGNWNPIRWIASKSRIMRAVNDNFTTTATHLQHKAASRDNVEASTAKGLLRTLLSVRFICFLGFICDFTTALSNLSEAFQSDNLSLSRALDELDATLGLLEQLSTSPGHVYSKFLQEVDNPMDPTKFRGFDIVGGKKGLDLFKHDSEALAKQAVFYLENRFRVEGVIKDFKIFDPSNWPIGGDCSTITLYGEEELSRILYHFRSLFTDEISKQIEEQWLRLKLFVCERILLHERNFHTLWPRIATQENRFANIMKLISLVSLLPMSTAACERGFSMMNRIKSDGRSRMGSTTLNSLMCISIDGPSLESFDAQPAVNQWSSEVRRRPGHRKPSSSKDVSIDSSSCFSSEYEFSSESSDYESIDDLFDSDS
jgi:hypothetical protein